MIQPNTEYQPVERLSNKQLLVSLEAAVRHESESTIEVLLRLGEVETRKLHLILGYGSMFDYCVKGLRYSESSANRRIRAARCARTFPAVLEMLRSRRITVTTLSMVASFLTPRNVSAVLGEMAGKTQREVDEIVGRYRPRARLHERIRPVLLKPGAEAATAETTGRSDAGDGRPCRAPALVLAPDRNVAAEHRHSGGTPGVRAGATPGGNDAHRHSGGRDNPSASPAARSREPETMYRIELFIDAEARRKLDVVRSLASHRLRGEPTVGRLFALMLDDYVDRHHPACVEARRARRRARPHARTRRKVT